MPKLFINSIIRDDSPTHIFLTMYIYMIYLTEVNKKGGAGEEKRFRDQ